MQGSRRFNNVISENSGVSVSDVIKAVETTFNAIFETLENGGEVQISVVWM